MALCWLLLTISLTSICANPTQQYLDSFKVNNNTAISISLTRNGFDENITITCTSHINHTVYLRLLSIIHSLTDRPNKTHDQMYKIDNTYHYIFNYLLDNDTRYIYCVNDVYNMSGIILIQFPNERLLTLYAWRKEFDYSLICSNVNQNVLSHFSCINQYKNTTIYANILYWEGLNYIARYMSIDFILDNKFFYETRFDDKDTYSVVKWTNEIYSACIRITILDDAQDAQDANNAKCIENQKHAIKYIGCARVIDYNEKIVKNITKRITDDF